jgi:hypothetical protein
MAAVLQLAEGAAPSTPGSGYHNLYFDSSGLLHVLTDGGVNTTLADTGIVAATANIADAAVTNVKLADMAEETIKGRASGAGTGDATDLTPAQVAAILAAQFPALGDAAWTDATLGTYWTSAATIYPTTASGSTVTWSTLAYRKVGGVVYIRGVARCSNSLANEITTLPSGYRPAVDMWFPAILATASTAYIASSVLVKTDGTVWGASNSGNNFHFGGICFPV